MKATFADTSFFVAALNHRDVHHAAAARFLRGYSEAIVTSHWVLLEVANYFARSTNRAVAAQFIESVLADPKVECVSASVDSFMTGLKLFRDRPDKHWSLTDCVSFEIMKQRAIHQALTTDHHFEQAGFDILLK